MTTRKAQVSRSVDGLVRRIWSDDTVLCLAFRDDSESILKGYGCSEDHGCHDLEAFLRVISEMKKRKIERAEFRILIPANPAGGKEEARDDNERCPPSGPCEKWKICFLQADCPRRPISAGGKEMKK